MSLNQVYAMICLILGLNGYKWSLGNEDASAEAASEVMVVTDIMYGKGFVEVACSNLSAVDVREIVIHHQAKLRNPNLGNR